MLAARKAVRRTHMVSARSDALHKVLEDAEADYAKATAEVAAEAEISFGLYELEQNQLRMPSLG